MLLATHAMGTRFELVLAAEDGDGALRAAGEEALREIELWHARLSRFEPGSVVAGINRAGGAPCRVDPETLELLEACLDLHDATSGAFDVTLGGMMEQLGLQPRTGGAGAAGERVERPYVLDRGEMTVRLAPGAALDLGGIAKGFALDRAAAALRACGVRRALLHGGTSSVVAIGAPEGQAGWPVAVRSEGAPLVVHLRDEALSVSAPRGRVGTDREGKVVTHILDPRTGRPAGAGVETAAVAGPSGAVCEAWSTALIVLGRAIASFPAGYVGHVHEHGRGWRPAGSHRLSESA